MKKRNKRANIVFLILWNIIFLTLIFLIQGNVFGQYQKPPPKIAILLKDWSVNVNGGKTSFFGELSLYDDELTQKLSKEGAWAYGFLINRKISPVFGMNYQMIWGTLKGSNSSSYFEAKIKEWTINTTLNLVNLLMPNNNSHFFLYAKLGAGQLTFDTKLVFDDAEKEDILVSSESPEFLYLLGGGAYYRISYSFDVNIEATARLMNNDKLDGSTRKNDNDYYSYISLGLTYKIKNKPRDTRYYKRMGMKSPLLRRRK